MILAFPLSPLSPLGPCVPAGPAGPAGPASPSLEQDTAVKTIDKINALAIALNIENRCINGLFVLVE
ncbi:hypothetical protein F0L74_27760 [Chitinophaga agrisoli]|uniref:Uncharacterized protein n=1 Tax=Chitinophaga agrisoli TaxID=2607653 RepID=A0A5B2VMT6_9BACT|nr:hypothetical protein F0L74_27760 [Chitinophaga agrisoli]